MEALVATLLRYRTVVLIVLVSSLAAGTFGALKLDVEAYPDPSPPLVEIITQNPAWSAEEIEQQVTAPIELTLNGTPLLEQIRSISIFGLSDVKLYFKFSSDLFHDRQEILANVWRLSPEGISTRTIDMHVARLREKLRDDPLDPQFLLTVRGKGYMVVADRSEGASRP